MNQFTEAYLCQPASMSKVRVTVAHTFCRHFKCIPLKYAFFVLIVNSKIFFRSDPTDNNSWLVQAKAWYQSGMLAFHNPMMVSFKNAYACYDNAKKMLSRHILINATDYSSMQKTWKQKGRERENKCIMLDDFVETLTITNIKNV